MHRPVSTRVMTHIAHENAVIVKMFEMQILIYDVNESPRSGESSLKMVYSIFGVAASSPGLH